MSLLLPNFFVNKGYLENKESYRISESDLLVAKQALASDIDAFFLNGLISFSSSIHSLKNNNYSWAFIHIIVYFIWRGHSMQSMVIA